MTPLQAAAVLECSPVHVRRLCQRGELRAWKIGTRRWRIAEADFEAYRVSLLNAPEAAPELAPVTQQSRRLVALPPIAADDYEPVFPELWSQS